MLSKETFLAVLKKFEILFEFEPNTEYSLLVYKFLKDKTNDEFFMRQCQGIIESTTKEDWNKAYGYKGRPAVADWVNAIVPKPKMIEKTKYYKCEITGATLVKRVLVEEDQQLRLENEK